MDMSVELENESRIQEDITDWLIDWLIDWFERRFKQSGLGKSIHFKFIFTFLGVVS